MPRLLERATTRSYHVISGLALAALSLLCLAVGLVGLIYVALESINRFDIIIALSITMAVGIFCSIVSYRLIKARGTRLGAGLLSPTGYNFLGCVFIGIGALLSYKFLTDENIEILPGVLGSFFLGIMCFKAAQFRGRFKGMPD